MLEKDMIVFSKSLKKIIDLLLNKTKEVLDKTIKKPSNISKESEVRYNTSNDSFEIWLYDYYLNIEYGRRAFAKQVPINILLEWCIKENIPNPNKVVWAIQKAIYYRGIKKRPFLVDLIENSADIVVEELGKEIFKEVENVFITKLLTGRP